MLNQRSSVILMLPGIVILLGNISGCSNSLTAQAEEIKFVCIQVDGVPTTVAKKKNSDIPIIKWISTDFPEDGYSPSQRCSEVSGRFQSYYPTKLNYITTGQMNNVNVICTADREGGDCTNLLFTVRPNISPQVTLKNLIAVRNGNKEFLIETVGRTYVNVGKFLRDDSSEQLPKPVESPKPVQSPKKAF